jgi:hypothetical protein
LRARRSERDSRAALNEVNAMIGKILVVLCLLAVGGVLIAGVTTMAIGGETAKKWSNLLMRYRILAQAIAIIVLMAVLYFGSGH